MRGIFLSFVFIFSSLFAACESMDVEKLLWSCAIEEAALLNVSSDCAELCPVEVLEIKSSAAGYSAMVKANYVVDGKLNEVIMRFQKPATSPDWAFFHDLEIELIRHRFDNSRRIENVNKIKVVGDLYRTEQLIAELGSNTGNSVYDNAHASESITELEVRRNDLIRRIAAIESD
ncbi:MAG: hypothetical protein NUW37_09475 [Planctomycetes bacterium]|nr:hypothetical protein [Planctomycetota bacterium]